MWTKLKVTRDTVLISAGLIWGSYEILHDARPGVLVLVGAMLGLPVAARADEVRKKLGNKRDDTSIPK